MSAEAHLRRRVAQRPELALELLAVLLRHEPDVEEAHHLPELHRRALHRPERGHDLLGGLEVAALERGALALLGAGEVRRVRAELARGLPGGEARDPRGAGDPRGGDAVLGHAQGVAVGTGVGLGGRRRAPAAAWPAAGHVAVAVVGRRRGGRRRRALGRARRRGLRRLLGRVLGRGGRGGGRRRRRFARPAAQQPRGAVGVADLVAEDGQLGRGHDARRRSPRPAGR